MCHESIDWFFYGFFFILLIYRAIQQLCQHQTSIQPWTQTHCAKQWKVSAPTRMPSSISSVAVAMSNVKWSSVHTKPALARTSSRTFARKPVAILRICSSHCWHPSWTFMWKNCTMPWLALAPTKTFWSRCYARCRISKFIQSKMPTKDVR